MNVLSDGNPPEMLERAFRAALALEGFDPAVCEVSVSLASRVKIKALNKQYRMKDEATDVLSFPFYDGLAELRAAVLESQTPVLFGDIVICREIAERQAEEYGHSVERELGYLFVHGVLHLMGYDHDDEEERRVMRAKEEAVLTTLELVR